MCYLKRLEIKYIIKYYDEYFILIFNFKNKGNFYEFGKFQ